VLTLEHPIQLTRTVRLFVTPGLETLAAGPNSYAGIASDGSLGCFYEVTLHCVGELDARTGFIENIYEIDRGVGSVLTPALAQGLRTPDTDPVELLLESIEPLAQHLEARLTRLDLALSPTYRITLETADMTQFLLAQRYQFAASHRLYNPDLDDSANRNLFGKCCNENGHGHNYRLEVEVAVPLAASPRFTVADLDSVVHEAVIDHFDHTYLNLDVADFASNNPTVENITVACYERLADPLRDHKVQLRRVRLWETEKTCCVYPADS
jgi:6-pyruvoyltetrahydropterin/6-carboxytetrahydropterin synthase